MAPKELLTLRLLMENPRGLYASELMRLADGKLGRGTVYTLLDRMVKKGLIKEVEEPPTAALAIARTRHLIAAVGRKAYQTFLDDQFLTTVPMGVKA